MSALFVPSQHADVTVGEGVDVAQIRLRVLRPGNRLNPWQLFRHGFESRAHELCLTLMVDGALYPLPCRLSFLVVVGRDPFHPETVRYDMRHVMIRRIPCPSRSRLSRLNALIDGPPT